MKEADAGDAGGSGCEAGGGVLQCDATQRIDRDGGGCAACVAEPVEALSPDRFPIGEGFFKDGGEENGVGMVFMSAAHVFEGVAGGGDDWRRETDCSVEAADLGWGELVRCGGEVDSGSAGCEGDVGAGVDQQLRWTVFCADGGEDFAGKSGDASSGKVFFAELDEVDALVGPAGGFAK